MLTSPNTHELSTLLRISSELDIVGDVTATVDTPSALLAWAHALPEPTIRAWRAEDSGNRYLQVTATCHRTPLHGQVTAVLPSEDHRPFWSALLPEGDLTVGEEQLLPLSALVAAWSTAAPESGIVDPNPMTPRPLIPPTADSRDVD
ncbi:MAG: hypothetical protein JO281_18695 [Pseudonocardiales bacterium]|nr:hypothetical protein [Pseudonocardiales bacterium]